jgi:hypothetical protein
MTYFPCTNEYLYEARGGAEGAATSSNKYRNTCGRQRRGRSEEKEEEGEKRERTTTK